MERALVLIGVKKTGGLPELPAVGSALLAMRDWAGHQGIPDDLIKEFSDVGGQPVEPAAVVDAVLQLTDRPTLEQLIIFFCGHGLALNYSEYWLLSGAPKNGNAAINVAKSVELAVSGRVPHVVFVSDACRSAAARMNAQGLTGTVIMPNPDAPGASRAVDVFYACLLGDPAHEVQDPEVATTYHAVYTEVFTDGLEGDYPESVDEVNDGDGAFDYVRPGKLKDALPPRLADRLAALDGTFSVNQEPDARISYYPNGWLSRFPIAPAGDDGGEAPLDGDGDGPGKKRGHRRGPKAGADHVLPVIAGATAAERLAAEAAQRLLAPIEWDEVPGSGFLLRGAKTTGYVAGTRARGSGLLESSAVPIEFGPGEHATWTLVAVNDGGVLAVVPVLRDHTSVVTVEDGQVVDIWLAARRGNDPPEYLDFRADVAARSRYGLPITSDGWAAALDCDPSLALYRAYALADAGRRDDLPALQDFIRDALGTTFYDLELMQPGTIPTAMPGLPLMGRGWALLDATASATALPAPLYSLWTLFPGPAFAPLLDVLTEETGYAQACARPWTLTATQGREGAEAGMARFPAGGLPGGGA